MITIDNYFGKTSNIDFSKMNDVLRKGNEFVLKITDEGSNWDNYHVSESIKKTVDLYLQKLSAYIKLQDQPTPGKSKSTPQTATSKKEKKKAPPKAARTKKTTTATSQSDNDESPVLVERIPEEIRFIRRFVNLYGKEKTKEDLLRFINSLQKAILEKRIRKTSAYAEQVRYIQDRLIETYNTMKGKMTMQIKQDVYDALKKLSGSEKVLPSINFIKRYIGMNGKAGMKEKAKLLLTQIDRAYENSIIKDGDAYSVELYQVKKNLRDFISEKGVRTLNIEKATLNGLQGILNGCKCGGNLNGIETVPASLPPVMNSMDFAKVKFRTLGFKGKWLELIGDPTSNFTAMVFGKPKFGKSHFCVEWAGYLARNHGKVLYVAKEEGLDKTLQEKLDDKNVKHPNLDVASALPENLAAYDFIFLDSVNRLGLSPEDLRRLKVFHPTKSFVYIFQTTKQGNFRGANSFQHDVDIVIEVPEKGKVVQMGRFNQGGEMEIFTGHSHLVD